MKPESHARVPLLLLIITALPVLGYSAPGHQFGDPLIVQQPPLRTYHVQNYSLTLHFDETRGEVFGDEAVTLEPLSKGFKRFYLNSSGLTIETVRLVTARGSEPLSFQVEDPRLWIRLDRVYGPRDRLTVRIVYHGFPRAGLFFVNPNPNYPEWPTEIWSQGEPEFNHYWFPCWDYPNDMATSETITIVPDGQSVVSNGKLIRVTHHAGQTTYDWLESIPHSSYLISIAVGTWRKVSDHYRNIPVDYYVPSHVDEATARRSFHLTPDMLGFFSRAAGVTYPYEQYAQVAVHNYIFGGMENVSATTLTDETLHDERADDDYSSQALVAHELGQEWFGDLVQGRDWGNIWLNESFATYMEALYTQYHEGNDAFRFEMMKDQLKAQRQDREDYLRPIVDDHYRYPLQMFDSITHEKGAVVLDMLRNILDGTQEASQPASQKELLFRALKSYLIRYRARAVDTADLIRTIEAVTDRHLGWFFHEWVFMAGFPHYRVTSKYDPGTRSETVTVLQVQRGDGVPQTFEMPVELAFYGANDKSKWVEVLDNQRTQKFRIPLDFEPKWADFDPDDVIEKTLEFPQPLAALVAKAEHDPAMMSRLAAVEQLSTITGAGSNAAVAALSQVLDHDPFYGVRVSAAAGLGRIHTRQAEAVLLWALPQADSRVRVAAIEGLATFHRDRGVYAVFLHSLHDDPSYAVQATAAIGMGESGISGALQVLEALAHTGPDIHVMQGIFTGLAATGAPRAEALLLHYAEPGVPERMRLEALEALAQLGPPSRASDRTTLVRVARSALNDPFLLVQMAGENLAGADDLSECRQALSNLAHNAPTAFQRAAAQAALNKVKGDMKANSIATQRPA